MREAPAVGVARDIASESEREKFFGREEKMNNLTPNPNFVVVNAKRRGGHWGFDTWFDPVSYGFTPKTRVAEINPFLNFFWFFGPKPEPMNPFTTSNRDALRVTLHELVGVAIFVWTIKMHKNFPFQSN